MQRRIWRALEEALTSQRDRINSLLLVGNGIAACNTPQVITSLLTILEIPGVNHNLVYNRLKDSIQPEQVAGWRSVDVVHLKQTLTGFATLPGSQTRSMTIESHMRRLAWGTALLAGITDVSDWLDTLLHNESTERGIQDVLSFVSYIRLNALPEKITRLIRERINVEHGNDATLLARINAIQVARATATREAFEVLLDCGLTFHGAPLRSTAEAVGDLAELIAKYGLDFVLSRLFAAAESKELGERRILAIVGLERLSGIQAIPREKLGRLVAIATDKSLPGYAAAAAISSIAC